MGKRDSPHPSWQLRTEALLDVPYRAAIGIHLTQYFESNEATGNSSGLEWDAMKVVMRGHCIKTSWGTRHILQRSVLNMETQIRKLEQEVVASVEARPCLTALRKHREESRRLSNIDYKSYVRRQHAEGDKPGRVLAWLLRTETPRTVLGAIQTSTGEIVNTQVEINEVFAQ